MSETLTRAAIDALIEAIENVDGLGRGMYSGCCPLALMGLRDYSPPPQLLIDRGLVVRDAIDSWHYTDAGREVWSENDNCGDSYETPQERRARMLAWLREKREAAPA